ncbi:MAG: hypothetical protein KF782_27130 [Labilithrix sp.]|nr:hypothetical protein [Labilithrix sp.]
MSHHVPVGAARNLAWIATLLACSGGPAEGPKVPENVAAVSMRLDFEGNSVRITGARDPSADAKYACASSFSACLNFSSEGTTDVVVGLCPSEDAPAGTWDFSYEVFDGADCAGAVPPNFDCPDTTGETLPAGVVTTNHVTCSSLTAGKTWDFDIVNLDPDCPDGATCEPATPLAITYSGSAAAVRTSLGLAVGAVGPLPPTGGSLSDSQVNVTVPTLGTLGALTVQTQGAGATANSSATVTGVNFGVISGLVGVTATLIGSTSQTTCPPTAAASSTITGLALQPLIGPPIPITATGAVNQVVLGLPVGVSLILNEQVQTVTPTSADITVNAVRLTILGLNIIIGQSHSDITCTPP